MTFTQLVASAIRRHAEWLAAKGDALHANPLDEMFGTRSELDNARAAIAWCLESGSQTDVALAARIVGAWRKVWVAAGRYIELRHHVADVLEKLDEVEANYDLIARLWRARLTTYIGSGGDLTASGRGLIQQAAPFLERAGDAEGIASMYAQLALGEAAAGSFARANESLSLATRYYEADEIRKKGDGHYFVSISTAWVFCAQGKIERARAELVALDREMKRHGANVDTQAYWLSILAEIEFASGKTALAIELCSKALDFTLELHGRERASRPVSAQFSNLSSYQLVNGDLSEPERCGRQGLRYVAKGHSISWIRTFFFRFSISPRSRLCVGARMSRLRCLDSSMPRIAEPAYRGFQRQTNGAMISWLLT